MTMIAIALSPGNMNFANRWWTSGATLDLDFVNNRAFGAASIASALSLTRASVGYAESAAGVWSSFASGVLRVTDKGLLVEESRINSIRNNSAQGVVVGSPGSLPTNWSISNGTGLTRTVVGSGTVNGIDYVDIRFAGTTGDANGTAINFDTTTGIAALNAQTWANSAFLALVGGTFTNVGSIFLAHSQRDAGGAILADINGSSIKASIGSSMARIANPQTLNNASTAFNQPRLSIQAASGVAVDYTIRIGLPQIELGAFMTSPIRTTSAAATRASDSIFIASLTNIISIGTGTIFAEVTSVQGAASQDEYAWSYRVDGNNRHGMFTATSDKKPTGVTVATTSQASCKATTAISANATFKSAYRWNTNDFASRFSSALGAAPANDTSGSTPVGAGTIWLGSSNNSVHLNGYLRRLTLFPTALGDSPLAALVA